METKNEIIMAVLALVILIIGLVVVKHVFSFSNPESLTNWANTCGSSVTYAVKMSNRVFVIKPDNFKCPTKYFYVDDKGIFYKNSLWMSFDKNNKNSTLKKALAYDLFSCAKSFKGAGLKDSGYPASFNVICSSWYFNTSKEITLKDFYNYLNSIYVPYRKETFYNYLMSLSNEAYDMRKVNEKLPDISITLRPKTTYSTVFFYFTYNSYLKFDVEKIEKVLQSIPNCAYFLSYTPTNKNSFSNADSKKPSIVFIVFIPTKDLKDILDTTTYNLQNYNN